MTYRRRAAAERAAAGPDPGAASIMALVVELADEQLCVRAIHRLVHGAPARPPDAARRHVRRPRRRCQHPGRGRGAAATDAGRGRARSRRRIRPGAAGPAPRPARTRARGPARAAAIRRRLGLRRRRAPRVRRRRAHLPQRRADRRLARRQGRGRRRGAAAGGDDRPDPRRRARPTPDAGEDDVLRTQAADGNGLPRAGRSAESVDFPGRARVQQRGEVAGAVALGGTTSWRCTSSS